MPDTIICTKCKHFSVGAGVDARCALKAIDNPRAVTCLNCTPTTPSKELATVEVGSERDRLLDIVSSLFGSLDDRNAKIDRHKITETALNKQCYTLQTKVTEINSKNESLSSRNSGLKKNNTSLVEENRSLRTLLSKIYNSISSELE